MSINYVAEAQRLGIPIPYGLLTLGVITNTAKQQGIGGDCVTDCYACRRMRNEVRAALLVEAQEKAEREALRFTKEDMDRAFKTGRYEGFYEARRIVETGASRIAEELYQAGVADRA